MSNPFGKPLGGGSALDQLLRGALKDPGDLASVLTPPHKNGTEVDANGYVLGEDGRIRLDWSKHTPLDPNTLTPKK